MAKTYKVTNEYKQIDETSATLQNTGTVDVFISTSNDGPGIVVGPMQTVSYRGGPLYARVHDWGVGEISVIDVLTGGVGGSTDAAEAAAKKAESASNAAASAVSKAEKAADEASTAAEALKERTNDIRFVLDPNDFGMNAIVNE